MQPPLPEVRKQLGRLVRGLVESAKPFVRWMDGSCLETPEQQVPGEEDEPHVFSFFQDLEASPEVGWRLAGWLAGGWRLAAGGWRLAAGGWRLAAGSWRLAAGGCLQVCWPMAGAVGGDVAVTVMGCPATKATSQ